VLDHDHAKASFLTRVCEVTFFGSAALSESMSRLSRASAAKRVQYAALPYRSSSRSRTEVMLVTSRETRRWIIPKGWPHKGKAPHYSAAREAFEEAGIVGAIATRSVGSFFYKKRLKAGHFVICEVHVFPLKVSRQTKQWPERRQREVKWVSAKEAADAVQEPKLSAIIRHLARRSAE
jgi:8-oxo-dGTP pyrophosphatase MutT (NUDIX family)